MKVRGPAVTWCLPNPKGGYYKRPFAGTTSAEADTLIWAASRNVTWGDALEFLTFPTDGVRSVISGFVDAGYSDHLMSNHISVEGVVS